MARLASSDLSKSESQVSFGDGGPEKPSGRGSWMLKNMKNATENAGDSCFFTTCYVFFFGPFKVDSMFSKFSWHILG